MAGSIAHLLLLAAGVHAVQMENRFVFQVNNPLVVARLDPIISPGNVSQHVHRVLGGSAFSAKYDPVALRRSSCTTLPAQADKSNYWHPYLYKVNYDKTTKKTTYSPMWGQTRIYYNAPDLLPGTGVGSYIEPFPTDLRMLSGNPAKKTGGGYNQEDFSIFYYCDQGDGKGFSSYSMPTQGCKTIITKVWFPSCWNGVSGFDPKKTSDYVKFPNIGGGLLGAQCPDGYPHRFFSILVETFYIQSGSFPAGPAGEWGSNGDLAPTYILANGDTTGYGLHADFANGWDQSVLSQVVKQCKTTDFDKSAGDACPPLKASWDTAKAAACQLQSNVKIPDEDVGYAGPMTSLPGCNKPWGATGPKPTCANYRERRFVSIGRFFGTERNPSPSILDLANPFVPIPAASSSSRMSTTTKKTTAAASTKAAATSTKRPSLTAPVSALKVKI